MDTIDFKILKLLKRNSRSSFLSIASSLDLSGRAVQTRIERMINDGVILSFDIGFDGSLLGLNAHILKVTVKGDFLKSKLLTELKKIKNIYFVTFNIDNNLTILFHYDSLKDLEKTIEKIGFIKYIEKIEPQIPRSHHSTEIKLSPTDWKIIHSLNHNARKKNHEIAKELDVSTKTIKRRLDRLIIENVIFFTIDVDISKANGYIIYVLSIGLEIGVKREEIYSEIKNKFNNIWGVVGTVQPAIGLFMYAQRLSEIEGAVEKMKEINGVRTVKPLLCTSYHRSTEWYDKKLNDMTKK